jgi:hypothetical protein
VERRQQLHADPVLEGGHVLDGGDARELVALGVGRRATDESGGCRVREPRLVPDDP